MVGVWLAAVCLLTFSAPGPSAFGRSDELPVHLRQPPGVKKPKPPPPPPPGSSPTLPPAPTLHVDVRSVDGGVVAARRAPGAPSDSA